MKMLDENLARIRAHRNNIHRYRSLLKTALSDLERQFVERRLSEESSALEASRTFPLALRTESGLICDHGGRAVADVREILIRGSEKVIAHYRLLLSGATTEKERELYLSRIEREQRLLDQLRDGMPRRSAA